MQFQSIQMNNGKVFEGRKIGELTQFIIDKFSREKLSHDEAIIVLDRTKELLGEFAIIQLED